MGGSLHGGSKCQRVCVVFFGGPDDREVLELARRMAKDPGIAVAMVMFVKAKGMDYYAVTLRSSPEKC